jgi:hypothetical protein
VQARSLLICSALACSQRWASSRGERARSWYCTSSRSIYPSGRPDKLRVITVPGRVPAFEEVEPDVKTAWLGEQKAEAWQKAYDAMRAKYTVLLPAPPADASASAPASLAPKDVPTPSGEGGL